MARILLGTIATAHGVKGLVKVIVHADDPKLLNGTLHTGSHGDNTLGVTVKNSMGKYWLAAVEGIHDRNAAETLRGTELWIERADLPSLKSGKYYIPDLIGLSVIDEQGAVVGTLTGIDNFGAGDLLDILPPGGQSFYLPFTKENVPAVDIAGGKLTIRIPEGLL